MQMVEELRLEIKIILKIKMISCLIEPEMTSITITIEMFSNKSIYFYVIAKLYDINKCHFIYVYLNICHNKIYFVFSKGIETIFIYHL